MILTSLVDLFTDKSQGNEDLKGHIVELETLVSKFFKAEWWSLIVTSFWGQEAAAGPKGRAEDLIMW